MWAEMSTASILVSDIAGLDLARLLEMIRLLYFIFPGLNIRVLYTNTWLSTFSTTCTMLITAVTNIFWGDHGVSVCLIHNCKTLKLVFNYQNSVIEDCFSPADLYKLSRNNDHENLNLPDCFESSWFNRECFFPKF